MHAMLLNIVYPDRLKGTGSHVQGHLAMIGTSSPGCCQQLIVKMQTRGGRGHGPGLFGVHGLIAGLVYGGIRPLDVGRQWHVSVSIQQF